MQFALHGFVSLPFWFALAGVVTAWVFFLWKPSLADAVSEHGLLPPSSIIILPVVEPPSSDGPHTESLATPNARLGIVPVSCVEFVLPTFSFFFLFGGPYVPLS